MVLVFMPVFVFVLVSTPCEALNLGEVPDRGEVGFVVRSSPRTTPRLFALSTRQLGLDWSGDASMGKGRSVGEKVKEQEQIVSSSTLREISAVGKGEDGEEEKEEEEVEEEEEEEEGVSFEK